MDSYKQARRLVATNTAWYWRAGGNKPIRKWMARKTDFKDFYSMVGERVVGLESERAPTGG
jgi:hypothetical protein